MKNLKILTAIFLITLGLSTVGINATPLYYVGYVRNETVGGNAGTWETRKFLINIENSVGYDWLYQASTSRDVKARVKSYTTKGDMATPGYKTWEKSKNEVELSDAFSQDQFKIHIMDYYSLEFQTGIFDFGNTTLYNAEWWLDDRL